MAKVSGPLFSSEASGVVAGQLVFGTWKGAGVVRRHTPQKASRTTAQAQSRNKMQSAVGAWQYLSSEEKQAYAARAALIGKTGYNLFISDSLAGTIVDPFALCTDSGDQLLTDDLQPLSM